MTNSRKNNLRKAENVTVNCIVSLDNVQAYRSCDSPIPSQRQILFVCTEIQNIRAIEYVNNIIALWLKKCTELCSHLLNKQQTSISILAQLSQRKTYHSCRDFRFLWKRLGRWCGQAVSYIRTGVLIRNLEQMIS